MRSFTSRQNPDAALIKLLKSISITIDAETINSELDKHPDYPSLLAISDVLTNFNIENHAFRWNFDELANVPLPFIVHTHANGGDFLVVNKIDGENIFVSNEKWNRRKISTAEFEKLFAGVVLTVEPKATTTTTASNNTNRLSNFKSPAIIACSALLLVAALSFNTSYFSNLGWQTLLFTLFKTVGLITSVLLLIQSIDSDNPLVQVLCGGGDNKDCNAILSSKAAKVTDWLSWSEVGFFYFAGTWLLLLFGGGSRAAWQLLFILNLISLPYTIYSIYYQACIAKQWCELCCTVQALLWLEGLTLALSKGMERPTRLKCFLPTKCPFRTSGW